MKKKHFLWATLHIPITATVFFAIWFFFSPFISVKAFFDSLSQDNQLESFTYPLYQFLAPIILFFGAISLIILFFSIFFPEKSQNLLENILNAINAFPKFLKKDSKLFWQDIKTYLKRDKDWLFLIILILIGTGLRISLLNRPILHDEGYTYIAFILSGLKNIVSDYHLPNNHILFTIFGYFSTQLFGNAPAALRLPALIAGVLTIPASYFSTRLYFNRHASLLTSGIVATYPIFILYSTSARGYAQLAFLSILLWGLGNLLLKRKNSFIWGLFIIVSAAGFYTIPIMLYPFAGVMAWLFFAWLFNEYAPEYNKIEFLKALFFAGLTVVVLFALLYLPVFIKTGFSFVFNSDTIKQFQETKLTFFLDALISKFSRTWGNWNQNTASIIAFLLLFGLIISLLKHRTINKKHANYFLANILVILLITALQKAVGWTRLWFFFAPIYFSFAAAGVVYMLRKIKLKENMLLGVIALFILFSFGNTILWLNNDTPEMQTLRGAPSAMEIAAQYLSNEIQEDDAFVTSIKNAPALTYYSFYYDIPLFHANPANNKFTSLYVILQTPYENIEENLLNGTRDRVNLETSVLVYRKENLEIHKIPIVIFYESP